MEYSHPLRKYRQNRGITQDALARELGVTNVTVSRWEKGHRKVDGDLLPMVAEKTGIAPALLRPDLADLLRTERIE